MHAGHKYPEIHYFTKRRFTMKTLLTHGYVLTVDKDFTIIHDGALCYEGDKIIDIGKTDDLLPRYPGANVIDATKKIIMPGLINTHLHSGLIRGTAEDLKVWEWLAMHVDPKHRVLLPDDAYIVSKVCNSEALLSGTTTVMDMYRYMYPSLPENPPRTSARAFSKAMRQYVWRGLSSCRGVSFSACLPQASLWWTRAQAPSQWCGHTWAS